MNAIALEQGCLDSGTYYPGSLTGIERTAIDMLNIQYVICFHHEIAAT